MPAVKPKVKVLPKKEEKKPVKKIVAIVKKPQSPDQKRPPAIIKEVTRSPNKRGAYGNPFDRLSLRKRKPEMKDAWT